MNRTALISQYSKQNQLYQLTDLSFLPTTLPLMAIFKKYDVRFHNITVRFWSKFHNFWRYYISLRFLVILFRRSRLLAETRLKTWNTFKNTLYIINKKVKYLKIGYHINKKLISSSKIYNITSTKKQKITYLL